MIDALPPYLEYRASGVPWVGDIPDHWRIVAARQLGPILKGSGGSKQDSTRSGVPCIRYGELYSTFDRMIRRPRGFVTHDTARRYTPIQYGDVLFAASGEKLDEIGKSAVNLIAEPAVCGGDVIILRPSPPLAHGFAGYAFENSPVCAQKASFGRGTTIKHLYPSELRALSLPLPPPDEQAAIVRFLDWATRRIDRAIRAKRKLVALVTERKQAVIHRAVTRGLDPHAPMKDSGIPWLGEIPAHWEVRRLRHLINGRLTYGANEAAQFTNPDWPRYIRITDFRSDGSLKPDTFRSLPPRIAQDYLVTDGDLLLARSGATVGKAFLVQNVTGRACHAGYLIRARPNPTILASAYLFAYTQSPAFSAWKDTSFSSATIQNIAADKYANLLLPLPPLAEQHAILASIALAHKPLDATIARTQRQIDLLREYRARLVADVVTGKLDVRAAAAALPDEAPDDGEPLAPNDDDAANDDVDAMDAPDEG